MKKRTLYFDVLNIAACLAVISLHHNTIVHTYSDSLTWKSALIVQVVAYWCVPVFLMLTGATLMNYREKYDTKTFFKKRFFRTVIPFFAWSAIVLIWKVATGQYTFETGSIQEVINTMLNNKMESIYWYFPLLFSIYLSMPILSWLTEPKHRPTLRYVILIMFILQSTMIPLTELIGIDWNSNFALPFTSYLIYVFLGYYLSTCDLNRKTRYGLYISGAAGAVIRYVAIFMLSTRDGTKNSLFFNCQYFPAVMLAVAVFVWAKQVDWERVLARVYVTPQRVAKLSSYSLGIYLTHKIVMHYELNWLAQWGITNRNVLWRTIWIPVTYLLALALVALLKKIPGVRRIVP
ncbi:MAG: acyltransferase [Clostridiales bacterium]|nr:acyltransferase [Clostridiales bacterium]